MSPSQKIKTIRWTVRMIFLVGFTVLTWTAGEPPSLHPVVPACSPFLALVALVTGGCSLIMLPAALVFLVVILKKRFFCRWVCPAACIQCVQVCPSGAIPGFTMENKYERPMGVAVVDNQSCLLALNKECGICLNVCTFRTLDLEWDPVNMISTVVVDQGLCTGCGSCEYVCPVEPAAVVVKPL